MSKKETKTMAQLVSIPGETAHESPSSSEELPGYCPTIPPSAPTPSLRHLRAEAEIRGIKRALEQTGWNRRRAAELLSVSYRGLLYKIRQHNITSAAEPLDAFARR